MKESMPMVRFLSVVISASTLQALIPILPQKLIWSLISEFGGEILTNSGAFEN